MYLEGVVKTMLCVRAPQLEKRLVHLVQLTGETKSHYVRVALQALLEALEKEHVANAASHQFDLPLPMAANPLS